MLLLVAFTLSICGWYGIPSMQSTLSDSFTSIGLKSEFYNHNSGNFDINIQRRRLQKLKPQERQITQLWYTVKSTTTETLPKAVAEAAASVNSEHKMDAVLTAALGREHKVLKATAAPEEYYENPEHFPMEDLVDIVITVEKSDIQDSKIEFLDKWRLVIHSLHCIIVLAKDLPLTTPDIARIFPDWMRSYEVYTHADIEKQWGKLAYLAGDSGLSLRNFAFWVSDRTVIYAIDRASTPQPEPQRPPFEPLTSHSKEDNILNSQQDHSVNQHSLLRKHLANLFTPASPDYFNPYYDAYAPGADFPKGYPYALRNGVHTAVSHGLSLGDASYDALTRLAKPQERNEREPAVTMTVPRGSLFSMSHNNIAFNRRLVGTMFFYLPPIAGAASAKDKASQEGISGDYSELVSGWLLKTVADAVGVGVKSGAPYVMQNLPKSKSVDETLISRLQQALRGTVNGTFDWQDDLLGWLQMVKIDFGDTNGNFNKQAGCHGRFHAPEFTDLNVAIDCAYYMLANKLDQHATESMPVLSGVAKAMRDWLELWHTRNAFLPTKFPMSSYASEGPLRPTAAAAGQSHNSTCAVLTIVRDEQELLPLWLRYYRRHVNLRDLYVLDHLTTDNSTHPAKLPANVNYKVLYGNTWAMPVVFRSWQINKFQDRLLRFGYPCVIFSDTDELIVPNPLRYPRGLRQYLEEFLADPKRKYHRVHALEVGHISYGNGSSSSTEPPFDWSNPYILAQRLTYVHDKAYDKPLLSKVPLRYRPGFHKLFTADRVTKDEDLIMLHMRSFDRDFCMRREEQKFNLSGQMRPEEIKIGMANHWTTYHRDKKSGELCKYAQVAFLGERTSHTQYVDNTGRIKMNKFDPAWKMVAI